MKGLSMVILMVTLVALVLGAASYWLAVGGLPGRAECPFRARTLPVNSARPWLGLG
jgi:hypothetical protein